MALTLLILGIFLFIMLVVVHEFGHFIVARRNGVDIEEFGIFFPPRLWGHKTKGGWVFSINLIPLGGFVRLKGEQDSATGKRTYGGAKLGVKAKILVAGVVMNLLAAFVILTFLGWAGMPQLVSNQFTIKSDTHYIRRAHTSITVGLVEANSPASQAGIKVNDTLVSIGAGNTVHTITATDNLPKITAQFAGQRVDIVYKEGNKTFSKSVQLRTKSQIAAAVKAHKQEGYLGIALDQEQNGVALTRSTWSAPIDAAGLIGQFTALTFQGLGNALHGLGATIAGLVTVNHAAREAGQTQASSQVAGPVGIYKILKGGTLLGYQFVLMVIGIISLSLAIMNVLPIPPLDGGKLFMTLMARLFHKTLSEKVEAVASSVGFIFFILLFVLITMVDVKR